jgi:exonuclease III
MDVEVNPGPEPSKKGLSMVHMNIQSLYMSSITNHQRVKIDEVISTFVVDKPTDVICFSETWLHDQISNKLIGFPGYHEPLRNDRKDRQGGGVCAYISENIVHKRLKEIEPPDIDLLWLELKLMNKRVIVGVGYRPPRQSKAEVEQFMDQFTDSLNKAINLGAESLIILGDFNDRCTKWDSTHELSDLKNDFYDLIQVSDLVQLVNEPTHIGPTSASLIDLVITDSPGYVKSVDLLPPIGSRHATVYVDFLITYQRDKNYMRQVWDYDKGDYAKLNEAIRAYRWDEGLGLDNDINTKTETWTKTYLQLCSESIPNRVIKVKPRDLPWFTHECKCLIRTRNRLYNKFKRTRRIEDETVWKNKAREVRVSLNLARLKYRHDMMDSLSDPNLAPKKYWSLVKRIYGSKKGMGIPVLEVGSKNLSTSTDKANAFTYFFKAQQALIEPIGHSLPDIEMLTDNRLGHVNTTPWEVKNILNSLDLGKAHGGDGVSVRMLRETSTSINEPLSALINDSFSQGIVPMVWKRANISPVHKKNSRSEVSNYRPISLLSTLAKVQERIVFKRMYRFLSSNGLLTPKNSGFKEKDSAVCQLINIVDKIYKALESGNDVNMVFLDILRLSIEFGIEGCCTNSSVMVLMVHCYSGWKITSKIETSEW